MNRAFIPDFACLARGLGFLDTEVESLGRMRLEPNSVSTTTVKV